MRDIGEITGYHAHIYYEAETRAGAAALRRAIIEAFPVALGRWRESPVGPHARAMYQVAFTPDLFHRFVPWLMLNRGPLAILVHPETGDDVADHSNNALWLGEKLPVDLNFLRRVANG
ncbi:DOPA 4,5-dioxygenase family protein [Oceanibacterium hippocampi]|nr:DOPA 4,5-dioxygenase family protein [Oceanibacterium hippocampi]